jgi:hypothetical protein
MVGVSPLTVPGCTHSECNSVLLVAVKTAVTVARPGCPQRCRQRVAHLLRDADTNAILSATFSANAGSLLTLKVPIRCGFNPVSRHRADIA